MAKVEFEILMNYFSGNASPEEAELVEDFALSSPERFAYFEELFVTWANAENEAYQKPDIQKEWEAFQQKLPLEKPKHRKLEIWAVAASVLILIGIGLYFGIIKQDQSPEIITLSITKPENKLLSDSTFVTFQQSAEFSYPEHFLSNERNVTLLSGNATFKVHHNAQKPFIIHLQHHLNIRVTGTYFSVIQTPDEVNVNLHEGSVLFYNQKDTLALAAGQIGTFLVAKQKFLLKLSRPTKGSFQFKNSPLSEVAAQLQQYFHVPVLFKNPKIAHCHLTADFKNQSLPEIAQIIAVTFNFELKINENNIYFDGKACQ